MVKKGMIDEDSVSLLVENNISLQKVLTGLSGELRNLAKEIKQLLDVFKEASKTFGEEMASEGVQKEDHRELMKKIEDLIDQNKNVARGLILLESTMKGKEKSPYY